MHIQPWGREVREAALGKPGEKPEEPDTGHNGARIHEKSQNLGVLRLEIL